MRDALRLAEKIDDFVARRWTRKGDSTEGVDERPSCGACRSICREIRSRHLHEFLEDSSPINGGSLSNGCSTAGVIMHFSNVWRA